MIYSRKELREMTEQLLSLSEATEERVDGFAAAEAWLEGAVKADDGLAWDVIRMFLVLVTRIAESDGDLVGWENATLLGHKALDVLGSTLESARRELHGLKPLAPPPDDWPDYETDRGW